MLKANAAKQEEDNLESSQLESEELNTKRETRDDAGPGAGRSGRACVTASLLTEWSSIQQHGITWQLLEIRVMGPHHRPASESPFYHDSSVMQMETKLWEALR